MQTAQSTEGGVGKKQGWGNYPGGAVEWSQTFDADKEAVDSFKQLTTELINIAHEISDKISKVSREALRHPMVSLNLISIETTSPSFYKSKIQAVKQKAAVLLNQGVPRGARAARDEYVQQLRTTESRLLDYNMTLVMNLAWAGANLLIEGRLPADKGTGSDITRDHAKFLGID